MRVSRGCCDLPGSLGLTRLRNSLEEWQEWAEKPRSRTKVLKVPGVWLGQGSWWQGEHRKGHVDGKA